MNLWALIFITFAKLSGDSYTFKAGKLPYELKTELECKALAVEIKEKSPLDKGEFVCVKITKENTI